MECKGIHKERRKSLTFIYAALAVLMLWRALVIRKWFFCSHGGHGDNGLFFQAGTHHFG